MSDAPHTRTMTYREIADAFGISLRAAEARARRRVRQGHWQSLRTNDGVARLTVPLAELEAPRTPAKGITHPPTQGDTRGDTHPQQNNALLAEIQAAHERLTAELRQQVEAAEARALAAEGQLRETRELLSRREGELDGIKLATEHTHELLAQARREAAEAQSRATEASRRAEDVDRAKRDAEEALGRLRGRGLMARVLNRG